MTGDGACRILAALGADGNLQRAVCSEVAARLRRGPLHGALEEDDFWAIAFAMIWEVNIADPAERERGLAAKRRVEELVLARPVKTFGRFVADADYWDGQGWQDLAATLRVEGYAT